MAKRKRKIESNHRLGGGRFSFSRRSYKKRYVMPSRPRRIVREARKAVGRKNEPPSKPVAEFENRPFRQNQLPVFHAKPNCRVVRANVRRAYFAFKGAGGTRKNRKHKDRFTVRC